MIKLLLLGTDPCHLCEKAKREIESYQVYCNIPFSFEYHDIIDNDDWYETYQLEIPLLLHEASNNRLAYPFGFNEVLHYLQSLPSE